MKTVFNNEMVLHVWAQQSQDHGRNANDSLSFCGALLRSYAMNIAKFIDNSNVLLTSKGYSVTTAAHKSKARYALHSYVNVFTVPCIDISPNTTHKYTKEQNKKAHAENIKYYKDEIKERILKASRARSNSDFIYISALKLTDELNLYIDTFKLRFKHCSLPNVDDIKAAAKKEAAKKARAKIKQAKQVLKDNQEKIAKWLDGENVYIPHSIDVMLRIKGDIIETSQRASFPLKNGYLALKFINRCIDTKTTFTPTGKSIRLGHFNIDHIDANGNVKAGCHKVKIAAIKRIEQDVISLCEDKL